MKEKNPTALKLLARHSKRLKAGSPSLAAANIAKLIKALPAWENQNGRISRTYSFANYYETMAFVNALAWISHREDHHPDLEVGYNRCTVHYSTHSVGGLSENDFICAAKADSLFRM